MGHQGAAAPAWQGRSESVTPPTTTTRSDLGSSGRLGLWWLPGALAALLSLALVLTRRQLRRVH
jgi:hypothetical protein